ncbi:hypothetical protein YW3DRAFT_03660 [Streptomyces sp. MnatMP-M77]|nr:hypothetical protein YW3DRAFT_03660 [Streptomyces sp. MnatMP-M77]
MDPPPLGTFVLGEDSEPAPTKFVLIARAVRECIADGTFKPGTPLVPLLTRELEVDASTVFALSVRWPTRGSWSSRPSPARTCRLAAVRNRTTTVHIRRTRAPSRQQPPQSLPLVTFFVAPQWGLRPSGPA